MRPTSILFCLFLSIVILTGYAVGDDAINADYYFSRGEAYDIDQNYPEAFKWYKKAAELGHSGAQNAVGVFYLKGLGVAYNQDEAFRWLHLSADQGFGRAQVNLAYYYHTGEGVPKDSSKAENLLLAAANQKIHEALLGLAQVYNEQGKLVKALAWAVVARDKSQNDYEYDISRNVINDITGGGRVMRLDNNQHDQARALADSILQRLP